MTRFRSIRQVSQAVAAVAAFASAIAAEPPAQSKPERGLAEAREDYTALKSTRLPEQSALPLPANSVLELKTGEADPLTSPIRRRKSGQKTERELAKEDHKSRNWLIEAMAEQEKRVAKSREEARAPETGKTSDADFFNGTPARGEALPGTSGDTSAFLAMPAARVENADIPRVDVINPLDRFMSSWMTPGDFQLLARVDAGVGEPMHAGPSVPTNLPGPAEQVSSDLSPIVAWSGTAAPSDNPYLAMQAEEAITRAAFTPAAPTAAPAEPSHFEAPQISNQPPSLSEQLRTRDDAKYFKQLKRF